MGALSLTSSKARQREHFGPLVPMTAHVPYGDASAIENTLFRYQVNPTEVAAVVVEPIQGEGGYVVPPPDFLTELRKLCDRHGILLVCDEVQSGIGRTGKWWAFEHFGVVPDIVCTAKGLASGMPLGACVAQPGIMEWPEGAQGSTFGGNPVACAAAVATLELVETQYMANAARLGPVLLKRLGEIAGKHPFLGEPRGIGFMVGIDVLAGASTAAGDPQRRRRRIVDAAFRLGLILLPCGAHTIRFCPPLCMTEQELETGLQLFDRACAAS
jgi:4-aminobutyrate aminotransferase